MRRLIRVIAVGCLVSLGCQSSTPQPSTSAGAEEGVNDSPTPAAKPDYPDTSSIPFKGETLVFPPDPTRRERRPLPSRFGEAAPEEPLAITWPQPDDKGHFEFSGQEIRIRFNRPLEQKGKPPLTITPAVRGKTTWSGSWAIEFEANKPFDPDTTYTVEVGEVKDEHGMASKAWKATFRADPRIWVADKVISYIPKRGRPKVLGINMPGYKTGITPTLQVLFDQGVKPEAVEKLIRLSKGKTGKTAKIETTLAHPSEGRFSGSKVDKRYIVAVTPVEPLDRGRSYTLSARSRGAKWDDSQDVTFRVADPLKFNDVRCGYYRSKRCKWSPKRNHLEMEGREFTLTFNNTIGMSRKEVQRQISIEPAVKNLSVWVDQWSSDGRINVSGAFEPSELYRVKVGSLKDSYGSTLLRPLEFEVATGPLDASIALAESLQYLDGPRSRSFAVNTRNVNEASLSFWEVGDDSSAWSEARRRVSRREPPTDKPDITVPLSIDAEENKNVTTKVDLLKHLTAGHTYIVKAELTKTAFGADEPSYPSWSWASKPPLSMITVNDDTALALHARESGDTTFIHVAKAVDGQPVAGAKLFVDGTEMGTTDAMGFASVEVTGADLLRAEHDGTQARLQLDRNTQSERDLAPALANGLTGSPPDTFGVLISDRGIFRPGATMHFKAMIRRPGDGGKLLPKEGALLTFRLVDPNGKDVFTKEGKTNDMGSFFTDVEIDPGAEIGRYRAVVESVLTETEWASTGVQVAEFEPPRFKVDVGAEADGSKLHAEVEGRYLFGAAMEDANVSWTIRRSEASFPRGHFTAKGLSFRPYRSGGSGWMRTGYGKLDADGQFIIDQTVEVESDQGPQKFMVEAEVTDSSYRAIANRDSVIVHPSEVYPGIKLTDDWLDVGDRVPLELGVIDHNGDAVEGKTIQAVMTHVEWKRIKRPGPGGSTRIDWKEVKTPAGSCSVKSAKTVVSCDLEIKKEGRYDIQAKVGRTLGGTRRVWVWGSGGSMAAPSPGHRVDIITEKKRFTPGETAKLVVRNPFPEATALFTVEQGKTLHQEAKAVKQGPVEFDVKLDASHAPHVHATVTLLPKNPSPDGIADWKFGAVRLPVALDGQTLNIGVDSDKPHYEPGQTAKITIEVMKGEDPVKGAEVALAVVDEGVLRMTNFHATDPVPLMRPGVALKFEIADTRRDLAKLLERSSSPGDGYDDEGEASLVSTRKNFVRTALWKPDLRTDAKGRAVVDLDLPDNLTEFRMMAVVLDKDGRGGAQENSFEVRKPLQGIPIMPRFALAADEFEAAIMVHNGLDEATKATIKLKGNGSTMEQTVELRARGRKRVEFELSPSEPGEHTYVFDVIDGEGKVRDSVEAKLPVQVPGIDERPRIASAFTSVQEIMLQVPKGVGNDLARDAFVEVTIGHHMYPELGARLEFLVDYPHGCVEQTTSSTLPLLAARDVLPKLGFFRYDQKEIDKMIRAGLERLNSMKTGRGGLAYWPGGHEPNTYGTAYAMRAVALADAAGIEAPDGLLDGMATYLERELRDEYFDKERESEVKASIALSLSEAGRLPESSADMLMDTAEHQGLFGLANLALALSTLEGQDKRVEELLDKLEAGFDDKGKITADRPKYRYYYYGSDQRTKAQVLLALTKLRPSSTLAPMLVDDLVRGTGSYTTQSTAFGLLALREQINRQDDAAGSLIARLAGKQLEPDPEALKLTKDSGRLFKIPFDAVEGKNTLLRLETSSDKPVSYLVEAKWRRPFDAEGSLIATTSEQGPEVYRLYTTAKGEPVDMADIEAGSLVRVALMARLPVDAVERDRLQYLAMTDRIPAGFEPVQPDLWTVSRPSELTDKHPLYNLLRWGSVDASHVELRDDRVHLYFDRVWGEFVAGTYMIRATTPGTFTVPPAMAELMYVPDSTGYTTSLTTTVKDAAK